MDKIAIHCPTKELWKRVQKEAFELGHEWEYEGFSIEPKADWDYIFIQEDGTLNACQEKHKDKAVKGYTIIPAEEWLLQQDKQNFKVGDEVEVVLIEKGEPCKFHIGDKGVIDNYKRSNKSFPYSVKIDGLIDQLSANEIKKTPTYSVPLRAGDRVRFVNSKREVREGYITRKNGSEVKVWINGYGEFYFHENIPELIPTEADIVVGSVWERGSKTCSWFKTEIKVIKDSGNCVIFSDGARTMKDIVLSEFKLIHRGEEEKGKPEEMMGIFPSLRGNQLCKKNFDEKRTKPKGGKKMKTVTIREGLVIQDKNCDNLGAVKYWDTETGEVVYKEPSGKHTIGHIDNIYASPVKVEMPKPKAKKGKK